MDIKLAEWSGAVSTPEFILSLFLTFIFGFILKMHFVHYGGVIGNRYGFSRILPTIALTTLFVITIVKSSLALSLGLVGALSIVRFRTPIKEPEELAYIFTAIAIGLGFGAGHMLITSIATTFILIVTTRLKRFNKQKNKSMYLFLEIENEKVNHNDINDIIFKTIDSADLRRYDTSKEISILHYILNIRNNSDLDKIISSLKKKYKNASISFFDSNDAPKI